MADLTTIDSNVKRLVTGKRVAIIGGADKLDIEQIKEAEVLVRVNSHFVKQSINIDAPEILYCSCAANLNWNALLDPIQLSLFSHLILNLTHTLLGQQNYYNLRDRSLTIKNQTYSNYYHGPEQFFQMFPMMFDVLGTNYWPRVLAAAYSFHPLTGIMAIADLLRYDVAYLYVNGMSMYADKEGRVPAHAGAHSIVPQIDFLEDVLCVDKRVIYSPMLCKVLDAR